MENAKFLIEKILSDARKKADGILADANKKSEEMLDAARKQSEKACQSVVKSAETAYESALSRSRIVAELDGKKLILDEKRRLVQACFALAEEKILTLPDDAYRAYIARLIARYAESGDAVIVSENDKKRIGSDFVAKVAKENKLKLSLARETGNFKGGVILSQGGIDKNLTIEMQLKELQTELEGKVIAALGL